MGATPGFPDITQAQRVALMKTWRLIEETGNRCQLCADMSDTDRRDMAHYRRILSNLEISVALAFPEVRLCETEQHVPAPLGDRLRIDPIVRPEAGESAAFYAREANKLAKRVDAIRCNYPELAKPTKAKAEATP